MGKREEKQIARIKVIPADYTYSEGRSLAEHFGYQERSKGRTSGSRVLFFRESDRRSILLHKPHPSDVMSRTATKTFLQQLIDNGDIEE